MKKQYAVSDAVRELMKFADTEKNYYANVAELAELTHRKMMINGMAGLYDPITVCGVTVTCGDDLQSARNRMFQKLRSVSYAEIDSALASARNN